MIVNFGYWKIQFPTNKLLFHKTDMLRDIIAIYNKSQTNLKTHVIPMYIMNIFPFCLLINGFMFQCFHEPLMTCIAMTHVIQFILQKKTTSKTKRAAHYKVHIKNTSSIWWNNAIVLFKMQLCFWTCITWKNATQDWPWVQLAFNACKPFVTLNQRLDSLAQLLTSSHMWFLSQYFFPPKDWVKIGSLDFHLWFPIPKMDP